MGNELYASNVYDEITYPFPILNGCKAEVWWWLSYFIPHFLMYVIIYPSQDQS